MNRLSDRRVQTFRRIAPIALAVSFVPDIAIWATHAFRHSATASAVLPLMVMHVLVAALCLSLLPLLGTARRTVHAVPVSDCSTRDLCHNSESDESRLGTRPVRGDPRYRGSSDRILDALAELLDRISGQVGAQPDTASISAAVRGLDAADHQLHATAKPLALYPGRRARVRSSLGLFTAASRQARTLVDDVAAVPSDAPIRTQNLQDALDGLRNRTQALASGFAPTNGTDPALVGKAAEPVLTRVSGAPRDGREEPIFESIDGLNRTIAEMAHRRQ